MLSQYPVNAPSVNGPRSTKAALPLIHKRHETTGKSQTSYMVPDSSVHLADSLPFFKKKFDANLRICLSDPVCTNIYTF